MCCCCNSYASHSTPMDRLHRTDHISHGSPYSVRALYDLHIICLAHNVLHAIYSTKRVRVVYPHNITCTAYQFSTQHPTLCLMCGTPAHHYLHISKIIAAHILAQICWIGSCSKWASSQWVSSLIPLLHLCAEPVSVSIDSRVDIWKFDQGDWLHILYSDMKNELYMTPMWFTSTGLIIMFISSVSSSLQKKKLKPYAPTALPKASRSPVWWPVVDMRRSGGI